MKRWITLLVVAAAGLLAACSPSTTPGSSTESLAPIESVPAVSAEPSSSTELPSSSSSLDLSSPSTAP